MTTINDFERIDAAEGAILVTEELAEYALCVLPPVRGNKCFAMGEAADHTVSGEVVYYWFAEITGLNFAFKGVRKDAEAIFLALRAKAPSECPYCGKDCPQGANIWHHKACDAAISDKDGIFLQKLLDKE